jgi:hypothetical protein
VCATETNDFCMLCDNESIIIIRMFIRNDWQINNEINTCKHTGNMNRVKRRLIKHHTKNNNPDVYIWCKLKLTGASDFFRKLGLEYKQ